MIVASLAMFDFVRLYRQGRFENKMVCAFSLVSRVAAVIGCSLVIFLPKPTYPELGLAVSLALLSVPGIVLEGMLRVIKLFHESKTR